MQVLLFSLVTTLPRFTGRNFSTHSDVYSYGIVLFEISARGQPPYEDYGILVISGGFYTEWIRCLRLSHSCYFLTGPGLALRRKVADGLRPKVGHYGMLMSRYRLWLRVSFGDT